MDDGKAKLKDEIKRDQAKRKNYLRILSTTRILVCWLRRQEPKRDHLAKTNCRTRDIQDVIFMIMSGARQSQTLSKKLRKSERGNPGTAITAQGFQQRLMHKRGKN